MRRVALWGVLVLALVLVSGAAATSQRSSFVKSSAIVARAASCPVAGECGVNSQTGCPTDGPIQVVLPDRCVPLPTSLPDIVTPEPGSRCVENEYIQVGVPRGIDQYEAVWYDSYGSRWWTSPGTAGPNSITGEGGVTYMVPKGSAAWSAGGGSAPAGGCNGPPGSLGTAGWGVTEKYILSGTLTVTGSAEAAPTITVQASCPGGGSTTTNEQGYYQFLVNAHTTCTVTPTLINGLKSTPEQRVVHVHRSDVDDVDFQVPCGALVEPARELARLGAATVAARRRPPGGGGGKCKLDIFV